MKKIFVLLILTIFLLCGCHGAKEINSFDVPEEFDTSKQYEISFWAKNDTNKTQVEIYKKAIADFEALYPNIKVNLKPYTDYGRIYSDVITNIATGTTPNICITYPDHVATYMTGENNVVQLNTLLTDKKYGLGGSEVKFDSPTVDEMIPKFMEECAFGDEYYALPFVRSTEACYINKEFVEKLGYEIPDVLTWDFIWEVSEAAMAKDADGNFKVNSQKTMIPFIYKSTDNMMITMLKQKNAGYSNENGEILIFNDTTQEILDTVGKHAGNRSFSTFKISSYPGNFLNRGQCIFAIDSTAGATWMGTKAPNIDVPEEELVEFETTVRPIPQYDINNPKMISQGPSLCLFNKEDPQEVLASWLFMQFLLTNEVQISYASTEGYVPVTEKAQKSPEYLDYLSKEGVDNEYYYDIKLKATKLLIDNTDNTFVTPVFNGSATLRNEAGQLIESVSKSARRKEELNDEYYKKLYDTTKLNVDKVKGDDKAELGEMPFVSSLLIWGLVTVWILLFGYIVLNTLRKRKK
ncbi:MAG: extracellular solute-binding protein [Ruminococcaceae bacterium]|nr:extracellular solute-binding protein [Oscillospiraceae bacterium]